ncbi:MAG: hypothetical protein ACR2L2_07525 [Acidobacteriota bacterium]
MASRKKTKPSFDLSADVITAPQSGWVYRSDAPATGAPKARPARRARKTSARPRATIRSVTPIRPVTSIRRPLAAAKPAPKRSRRTTGSLWGVPAQALAAGLGTTSRLLMMGTRIVTWPFTIGLRFLGSMAR